MMCVSVVDVYEDELNMVSVDVERSERSERSEGVRVEERRV